MNSCGDKESVKKNLRNLEDGIDKVWENNLVVERCIGEFGIGVGDK